MENLKIYELGQRVPNDAKKEIKAGRLRGMTDVNPMWRIKRMTEIFGPVGYGWKYTIDKQWTETYGEEVKAFCNVSVFIVDPEIGEWSDAIPGTGGSSIVSVERNGNYVNDEGHKMALTDALSNALKALGIGAEVWYGGNGHNESKYEQYTQEQSKDAVPKDNKNEAKAIAEIYAATTYEEYGNIWRKWCQSVPSTAGTPFYEAAKDKSKEFSNNKKAKK